MVVWSNEDTQFAGTIDARGGANGGDGGSAEVSGGTLWYAGLTNLLAPHGRTGTLLLDPLVLDSSNIPTLETNLATSDISESATDSVTVSSAISSSSSHKLTLDAPVVAVNANISLPNGELAFGDTGESDTSVTSASSATLNVGTLSVLGGYPTVTLAGPITATTLAYTPVSSTLTSFTANNASNAIQNLNLTNGTVTLTGNLDVETTGAMTVANKLTVGGNATIVAGGNLTFGGGSPKLTVTGTTKLASTGGAFINNAGSGLLAGSGRKIVWSATDASGFNDGGLGYTHYNPVSYSNDPQGTGNVIYIKTASGLPLLTITANGQSIVYGSSDPTYTASYSGGSASDLSSAVQFQVSGAHTNAGTYTITPYGAASSTYRLQFDAGTLTITKAPLTITAVNTSTTYGNALPGFTASYSGLKNSDTSSAVSGLTLTTSATSGSHVGTYSIVPSGASASNYTITYANGTLTVNPAALTVTIDDATRRYGGVDPAFSSVFSGFVNGDTSAVVSGDVAYSTTATTASGVGTYAITGSGLMASNYTFTYVPGTLTITPAPLTIATANAFVTYGQPAPSLQNFYSGLVAGDTAASLGITISTNVVAGTNVGTYQTTLAGSNGNYDISYLPGTITISPALLTITANSFQRYQYAENPPLTASVSGLFGQDQVSNLAVTTTASRNAPAGSYPIRVTSDAMPNYQIQYVDGTAQVLEPTIIVTYPNGKPTNTNVVKQMQTSLDLAPPEQVVVGYALLGTSTAAIKETSYIVNLFLDAMTKAGVKITIADVYSALSNPATRDSMIGNLMPFMSDALAQALQATTPTPEQQALMSGIENYISRQRVAAADTAQAEFAQWEADQNAKMQAKSSGIGVAGVYASMIDAANPDGPPPDFLKQAQAGLTMSSSDMASFVGVVLQTAEVTGSNPDKTHALTGIPGTAADVGRAIEVANTMTGNLPNHGLGSTASVVRQRMKKNVYSDLLKDDEVVKTGTDVTKSVETTAKTTDAIEEGVDIGSTVAKVVSVGAKVLEVGGVVLEVVGNLVQIGVGIAGYAKIADYQKALDDASSSARQAVTDASLKSMNSTTLQTYLLAMMATGGQVAGQ